MFLREPEFWARFLEPHVFPNRDIVLSLSASKMFNINLLLADKDKTMPLQVHGYATPSSSYCYVLEARNMEDLYAAGCKSATAWGYLPNSRDLQSAAACENRHLPTSVLTIWKVLPVVELCIRCRQIKLLGQTLCLPDSLWLSIYYKHEVSNKI